MIAADRAKPSWIISHSLPLEDAPNAYKRFDARNGEGRTALMFAVINLHYETVKVLLDHGANVKERRRDGIDVSGDVW